MIIVTVLIMKGENIKVNYGGKANSLMKLKKIKQGIS